MARPLNTAPSADRSFSVSAVAFSDPSQARITPSSPSKMNNAGFWSPPVTAKPDVLLNTIPVGPSPTATSSGRLTPAAVYSVASPLPLSLTHHGVPGPAARPH